MKHDMIDERLELQAEGQSFWLEVCAGAYILQSQTASANRYQEYDRLVKGQVVSAVNRFKFKDIRSEKLSRFIDHVIRRLFRPTDKNGLLAAVHPVNGDVLRFIKMNRTQKFIAGLEKEEIWLTLYDGFLKAEAKIEAKVASLKQGSKSPDVYPRAVRENMEFGVEMSVDDFIALPEHPRQRNTALRANAASRGHLKKLLPIHQKVSIAVLNGVSYRVDGNTRAYLWQHGKLEKPKAVAADFYYCTDKADFDQLYDVIDNIGSAKKSSDGLYSEMNDLGFQPISSPLGSGKLTTALGVLKLAVSDASMTPDRAKVEISDKEIIAAFLPELRKP